MSLFQNIRGALQVQAATVAGWPAAVSYEGKRFNPTTGTAYARLTLMPTEGRSAVVGALTKLHRGLLQIDIFYPLKDDPGTGPAEVLADAVRDAFTPGSSFAQGGETVTVDYAERGPALASPDWLHVPVTVAWRCYSPNN